MPIASPHSLHCVCTCCHPLLFLANSPPLAGTSTVRARSCPNLGLAHALGQAILHVPPLVLPPINCRSRHSAPPPAPEQLLPPLGSPVTERGGCAGQGGRPAGERARQVRTLCAPRRLTPPCLLQLPFYTPTGPGQRMNGLRRFSPPPSLSMFAPLSSLSLAVPEGVRPSGRPSRQWRRRRPTA